MTFSFLQVALICLIYLGAVFSVAFATERGLIPDKIVSHPITYIFSLGIFASAWAYYGVIDLARQYGYGALAYYLGTGTLFLFAPLALKPLIELARRFQITSMADLLTFRYHSHSVGAMVTLCLILSVLPLLALQIQVVADTIHLLTHNTENPEGPVSIFSSRETLALIFCIVITVFAVMYGAKREHHKGLITAMAFESVVKLIGLLAVGLASLFSVFGGLDGLDVWLQDNPSNIENLYLPLKDTASHMLLLVFLATAVAMPHIFHMSVVENPVKNVSSTISWAFPLFLLLMALPIFPILWAGKFLGADVSAEYYPLAVPMILNSPTLVIISFVAGLSAATGALVAIALALSTMVMNHWILPATPLETKRSIYGQLVGIRRVLIVIVISAAYALYVMLQNRFNLTDLALTSFIASLQLLPGIIGITHWSRGNRRGLSAGLFVGMSIWSVGLLFPMLMGMREFSLEPIFLYVQLGAENWTDIALWAIGGNTLTFVAVSLMTQQSPDERYSAELCSEDELSHPVRMVMDVRSPNEIIDRLSERVGKNTAKIEVDRALNHLNLPANEGRPYALRRLRDEIEANLSGLLGIALSSEIMDNQVPLMVPSVDGATDINLIEDRLYHYRDHLTGLAAELNSLRLYHRRTLEELPLAVCSVGKDKEVLMWNSAMEYLSGIPGDHVTGSRLDDVLEPWGPVLTKFAESARDHLYKQAIEIADKTHWISLHKASIPSSFEHKIDGQVILLEDVTELQMLEEELVHSERLASVGRLAAGVAHEIGNPVTGIACLAQNLKYDTDNEEVLEAADQILSQTDRVSRIVHSLVSFSHTGKAQTSEFHDVNLRDCAQEAIDLLALQREKGEMNYVNDIPEYVRIHADSQRVIQIFVNLLSNARDASPTESKISIEVENIDKYVTFTVRDEGPGISSEIQDQVFEPFFTTKEPGEGTGLGLAMVYSIVEDHEGQLDIVSPADKVLQKGTKFVIKLPSALASDGTVGNTTS
ncbi:MAG: PAS domain S-box-containing protein [Flavobacteriales bacterium]|jgi:PAS domain S-box-containing protein